VELVEWNRSKRNDVMIIEDIMLRNIPTNMSTLENLKTLYLSELDIQNLNSSISALTKLESIQITKCALKEGNSLSILV
jgi:Leucine-rich repeat (LRR) protein